MNQNNQPLYNNAVGTFLAFALDAVHESGHRGQIVVRGDADPDPTLQRGGRRLRRR